jgi:deazaflavin-dependent oxidoreductase (nitroreductase family)
MAATSFESALENTDQLELTTTGRVTGRQTSCPVWFVRENGKLYLLPLTGSDSQWYKNVLKTPAVRLAAGEVPCSTTAAPVTDPATVERVVEDFRAKYGARAVADYYPHPDVAAEITLQ